MELHLRSSLHLHGVLLKYRSVYTFLKYSVLVRWTEAYFPVFLSKVILLFVKYTFI